MVNTIIKNVTVAEKIPVTYDTTFLNTTIAINSRKLDKDIQELKELADRLANEVSQRAIRI